MAIKIPPQSSGWLAWREREIYMTGEEANEQVRMATPKFTFGSSYLRALRVDRPEDIRGRGKTMKRRTDVGTAMKMSARARALSQFARRVDVHERVADGEDVDTHLPHAVVQPVTVVVEQKLAEFRALQSRECLPPEKGRAGDPFDGIRDVIFPGVCIARMECLGDVVAAGGETVPAACCPSDRHPATRSILRVRAARRAV